MNEKFLKLLKNLDLTNYQIRIYFSVLKNGLSTVLDIAKDTKLNRSQIYLDAPVLVEKGLLEVGSKRNRRYLAVNPKRLERLVVEKEQKLKELKSVLGEVGAYFESKEKKDENDFEIKIYEGLSQVKKAFEFELEDSANNTVYSLVGDYNYQQNFFSENYWNKWGQKFKQNKSIGKIIVDSHGHDFIDYKKRLSQMNWEVTGIKIFPSDQILIFGKIPY